MHVVSVSSLGIHFVRFEIMVEPVFLESMGITEVHFSILKLLQQLLLCLLPGHHLLIENCLELGLSIIVLLLLLFP